MPYVFEVQRFVSKPEWGGQFVHVGYMYPVFEIIQRACVYYNIRNPHMRPLGVHDNLCSECDPVTKLRYVLRRYRGEVRKIPPFE